MECSVAKWTMQPVLFLFFFFFFFFFFAKQSQVCIKIPPDFYSISKIQQVELQ
jgi:hypothetical protein